MECATPTLVSPCESIKIDALMPWQQTQTPE